MFNHIENPTEMLAWLSERNHQIPLEDLVFMMESTEMFNHPAELELPNFSDDGFYEVYY